jgi:hypothetical protein
MRMSFRRASGVGLGLVLMAAMATAAPTCLSQIGMTIVSDATFNNGDTTSSAFSCQLGSFVFSNFSVTANTGFPDPMSTGTPFNLTVGSHTTSDTLSFGANLSAGQDVELLFQISPGITGMTLQAGPGGGVSEIICSVQPSGIGTCPQGTVLGTGAVSGGGTTFFAVLPAGTDFVYKDVNGVSEFAQTVVPEPMTLSMMGIGLLGLGLLRRRARK